MTTSPTTTPDTPSPATEKKETREAIIKELQTERGSKVISYIVSTRQGVNFQIADDAVRIIYDHLQKLGIKNADKVDIFLHSFGGVGVVPWKLVNLVRNCLKSPFCGIILVEKLIFYQYDITKIVDSSSPVSH